MKIFDWLSNLFVSANQVKADYLCSEYGCVTKKSVNCGDGLCTKHHLLWHQRLEWGENWAQYTYHCNKNDIEPMGGKPNLKLVD